MLHCLVSIKDRMQQVCLQAPTSHVKLTQVLKSECYSGQPPNPSHPHADHSPDAYSPSAALVQAASAVPYSPKNKSVSQPAPWLCSALARVARHSRPRPLLGFRKSPPVQSSLACSLAVWVNYRPVLSDRTTNHALARVAVNLEWSVCALGIDVTIYHYSQNMCWS